MADLAALEGRLFGGSGGRGEEGEEGGGGGGGGREKKGRGG